MQINWYYSGFEPVFLFTVSRGILSLSVKGMSEVCITKLLWFCITSLCFPFEPVRDETKTSVSCLACVASFSSWVHLQATNSCGNTWYAGYVLLETVLSLVWLIPFPVPLVTCQRNSFATEHIQHFMLKWVDSLRKIQDTWLQSLSSYWSLSVVGCI